MLAVQGTTHQDVESGRVLVVLAVIVLIIYWRAVLKAAIILLAAAVIVLLGSGVFVLMHDLHHLMAR